MPLEFKIGGFMGRVDYFIYHIQVCSSSPNFHRTMEGRQVFYPRLKFSIGLFDSFSSSMLLFTKIPENESEAWGDFQFCSRHTPSDVTNFIQMVIHFQNGISSRTTYTVDF